jgi:hypothetical protein
LSADQKLREIKRLSEQVETEVEFNENWWLSSLKYSSARI